MNNRILKIALALMAGLTFTACTNDEVADNNTLPEGKYPLEIGSVSIAGAEDSQTRLTESSDGMSSSFASGDQISVKIGSGTAGTYKYSGSSFTAVTPAYWQNTKSATVTAWYPTDKTIDLSDQSKGLKYVLYATKSNVTYSSSASLSFSHKLAKVRIKAEKCEGYNGNFDVTKVQVKSYKTCTVNSGNTPSGSSEDYITMHKNGNYYEANLVPGTFSKSSAIKIVADGNTFTGNLSSDMTLAGGKIYTIGITVKDYKEVNVNDITGDTYTVSGKVTLIGDGTTQKTLKLVVEGGSELTLNNLNITSEGNNATIECQGNATIKLVGSNTVTNSSRAGIIVNSASDTPSCTLTIDGDDDSSLSVTSAYKNASSPFYHAAIGATNGANITINGGIITANASAKDCPSPGIGSAGPNNTCGTITINGGTIVAKGGTNYPSAIGCANMGNCGEIIINGGNVTATANSTFPSIGQGGSEYYYSGNITIGKGAVVTVNKGIKAGGSNTVTIKAGATVNNTKYTSDTTGDISAN